jgi:hypothetical protein
MLSVIGACTMAIAIALVPGYALSQGRPIKATLVQDLDFGIIGAANVPGTVTIQPGGAKIVSAGILDLGGVSAPALFLIQGEKNRVFTITLPVSATVTLPGGPSAVLIDFQSSPSITGILNQQGQATVAVGATMNISPTLWEGLYTDPFDIIVAYQ